MQKKLLKDFNSIFSFIHSCTSFNFFSSISVSEDSSSEGKTQGMKYCPFPMSAIIKSPFNSLSRSSCVNLESVNSSDFVCWRILYLLKKKFRFNEYNTFQNIRKIEIKITIVEQLKGFFYIGNRDVTVQSNVDALI